MHNIATIYRFNTPFLDLINEMYHLNSVIKKIEKSVEFDGLIFDKELNNTWNFTSIILTLHNNLWRIEFFYSIFYSLFYLFVAWKFFTINTFSIINKSSWIIKLY